MKNKNIHKVQSELITQLLGAVNSKEEFDYLTAEQVRLSFSSSDTIRRRYSKW